MTEQTDLAQRIHAALSRTAEPRDTGGGTLEEGAEVIGSVPTHLRHLHNLLNEVGDEMRAAESAFEKKKKERNLLHALFFNSLSTQVSEPDNASSVGILENWDVYVKFRSEEEDGIPAELAELLGGEGGNPMEMLERMGIAVRVG